MTADARSAAALSGLVEAMSIMTKEAHKKMSAQQMLFFFAVAYSDVKKQSTTLSDAMGLYGELGRSVEKTLVNFLDPTARVPDALGWLRQVEDPDDRRKKYLVLTDAGIAVIGRITDALRRG
jgi:hypothetical protein